jgi:hypothetical protein
VSLLIASKVGEVSLHSFFKGGTNRMVVPVTLPTVSNKDKPAALKCAKRIISLLRDLFADIQAIPILAEKLLSVASTGLYRFLGACTERMNAILNGTTTKSRLNTPDVFETMQIHPVWKPTGRRLSDSFAKRTSSPALVRASSRSFSSSSIYESNEVSHSFPPSTLTVIGMKEGRR